MTIRCFHWSSINDCVMHETDGTGSALITYTHEPGQYGPLLSENRGGVESYHHYDALGSTTMLTGDSGTVTDTFQYDAWGDAITRTGSIDTPYRWVGRVGYLTTSALSAVYVRNRSYSTTIARWTAVDIHFIDGLNLYVYAASSPSYLTDPSGNLSVLQPRKTYNVPIVLSPPCPVVPGKRRIAYAKQAFKYDAADPVGRASAHTRWLWQDGRLARCWFIL